MFWLIEVCLCAAAVDYDASLQRIGTKLRTDQQEITQF